MDEITSRLLIHVTANYGDSEPQAVAVGCCSMLKVSVCKQFLLKRCEHVSLMHSLAPTPVQFDYLFGRRPMGRAFRPCRQGLSGLPFRIRHTGPLKT
jgi:hypothetical protein